MGVGEQRRGRLLARGEVKEPQGMRETLCIFLEFVLHSIASYWHSCRYCVSDFSFFFSPLSLKPHSNRFAFTGLRLTNVLRSGAICAELVSSLHPLSMFAFSRIRIHFKDSCDFNLISLHLDIFFPSQHRIRNSTSLQKRNGPFFFFFSKPPFRLSEMFSQFAQGRLYFLAGI